MLGVLIDLENRTPRFQYFFENIKNNQNEGINYLYGHDTINDRNISDRSWKYCFEYCFEQVDRISSSRIMD